MLDHLPGRHRVTVGADKNYDTTAFVTDRRTTRHPGYRLSQRSRQRVEEIFGWIKTVGGCRKLRYIGVARNQLWAHMTVAAYNRVRMAKLALAPSALPTVQCAL